MDIGLITQYATVGLVLIILQGLLSADNAMVMAVLVRPLPDDQRKKHCSTALSEHLSYVSWQFSLLRI